MKKIKLYGTPMCSACKTAKVLLIKEGFAFEELKATEYNSMLNEQGIRNLPAIEVIDENGNSTFYEGTLKNVKELIENLK